VSAGFPKRSRPFNSLKHHDDSTPANGAAAEIKADRRYRGLVGLSEPGNSDSTFFLGRRPGDFPRLRGCGPCGKDRPALQALLANSHVAGMLP